MREHAPCQTHKVHAPHKLDFGVTSTKCSIVSGHESTQTQVRIELVIILGLRLCAIEIMFVIKFAQRLVSVQMFRYCRGPYGRR